MAGILKVDQIKATGSGGNVEIPSGTTLHAPGHVIQVQSSRTTSRIQTTSGTFQDTGIEISFTPKLANSKLLITYDMSVNIPEDGFTGNASRFLARIYNSTDSTVIGPASGTNLWRFDIQVSGLTGIYAYTHPSVQYLHDSWGTTAKTIKMQMAQGDNAGTSIITFNETYPSGQDSGMTIQEIAQ